MTLKEVASVYPRKFPVSISRFFCSSFFSYAVTISGGSLFARITFRIFIQLEIFTHTWLDVIQDHIDHEASFDWKKMKIRDKASRLHVY